MPSLPRRLPWPRREQDSASQAVAAGPGPRTLPVQSSRAMGCRCPGRPVKTLVYVHDPMCSWCWGFDPVLRKLLSSLPGGVSVRRLLGGLAPDSDEPMPREMREYIEGQWRSIQQRIPGTPFDFGFWTRCQPRRSTYPACRAVIAARQQGPGNDERMTHAIQRAYYLEARNPSDTSTLLDLAAELGLDEPQFECDLESGSTDRQLQEEIEESRALGIRGFPGLALLDGDTHVQVAVDYTDHRPMLEVIIR